MKQCFIIWGLLMVTFWVPQSLWAQEMDCRIQINASQVSTSDKTIFEEMQKALYEFVNNRVWTQNVYSIEERIECNIQITISEQRTDEFKGTIQVTSSRPVFNTGYKSPVLNILDKNVQFRYALGETLEFAEGTHNELTSLIAYYIYMVLGIDYDTFSLMGGSEFFTKAEKIVTTAQSSSYSGWKSFENRKNRYWLVENYLNSAYAPVREYSYKYHRLGLDVMSQKAADGRTVIIEGLQDLLKVHRQKPSSFIVTQFFDAKADEYIQLLSEAPTPEATRAVNILKEIDIPNKDKYDGVIKK